MAKGLEVSEREKEVLAALGERLTNAEIAARLHISIRTVETHVSSLLRKLGGADRRALAQHTRNRMSSVDENVPSGMVTSVSDPLVGRDREVRTVDQLLDRLGAAGGDALLITGEPGIGKTRLAHEVVARARSRGTRTIWLACWEGPGAPPLWMWSELLEQLGGSAQLLLPTTAATADIADVARFEQFDGVALALRAACQERPIVVVFDDLHWADIASLRLLAFVATRLRDRPCLMVATVRDRELPAEEVAALSRIGTTLALGGLEESAVRQVLTTIVGSEVSADAAGAVAIRSGGNPLFVSEFGRLMRSSGRREVATAAIPPAVAAVLQRRLARMSEGVIACLQAAAVAGSEFPVTYAWEVATATMAGLSLEAMAAALADATASALLIRTSPAQFRFAHDLLREVLLESTPLERRWALHRRAADILRERTATDPQAFAAVAAHLEAAEPDGVGEAAWYWEQAAHWALAMLAYEQAATWFGRARSLAPSSGVASVDLLLAEADALVRAGQLAEARARFRDAARLAKDSGDGQGLTKAVLGVGVGTAAWEVPAWDASYSALLEDALASLAQDAIGLRSMLLARLSVARTRPDSPELSERLALDALALARQVDDPVVLAQALAALCDAQAGPEHAADRRANAASIIKLGESGHDRLLALLGHRFLIVACLELGDFAALDAEIARFGSAVEQLHQPLLGLYAPLFRGMRALLRGQILEAERRQREVAEAAEQTGSENGALLAAALQVGIDVAADRPVPLQQIEGLTDVDPAVWPTWAASLAFFAARSGDRARADEMLRLYAADGFAGIGRDSEHLQILTMFGRAAVELGDQAATARLRELLLPHSGLWVVEGIGAICWGPVDLELARLEVSLGLSDDAGRHLDAARRGLAAAGASLLERDADALAAALGSDAAAEEAIENDWRREGQVWTLRYDGRSVQMSHAKGLADIAVLLASSSREVAAAELYDGNTSRAKAPGSNLGELLDAPARAAYRRRLVDLDQELADAEAMHDTGRAEKARAEHDFIAAELAAALGLGGRPRVAGDPNERARKAVANRVRLAIDRIEPFHPDLARHLRHSVKTGVFCSYQPERRTVWRL